MTHYGELPGTSLFPHPEVTVLTGDSRELLADLPTESVQCCVTSPPYWGLRDYDHPAQIGAEASPLQQFGLRAGRDVQIASHLNKSSDILGAFRPGVAVMEIDPQQIVAALFGMLETLMNGETPQENVVAIKPKLLS